MWFLQKHSLEFPEGTSLLRKASLFRTLFFWVFIWVIISRKQIGSAIETWALCLLTPSNAEVANIRWKAEGLVFIQPVLSSAAIPISSLEPLTLVEGQSYRKAALCRSVARPPPRISWDTSLNGQSTNRSSDSGAVTSHYSLHPLRAMNGMKLDCLVWHPTSQSPRRIKNNLVVHCEYPWTTRKTVEVLKYRKKITNDLLTVWIPLNERERSNSGFTIDILHYYSSPLPLLRPSFSRARQADSFFFYFLLSSPSACWGDRLQRRLVHGFEKCCLEVRDWRKPYAGDHLDQVQKDPPVSLSGAGVTNCLRCPVIHFP